MHLIIKLTFCILCLNLNFQIGKAECLVSLPVEKVKPPVKKKKSKTRTERKKNVNSNKTIRHHLSSSDKYKNKNHLKDNSSKSQQVNIGQILFYISLILVVGGIIAFIVGAALLNLLIWIIGLGAFLIGFIYWIFYAFSPVPYYNAALSILAAAIIAIIGVILFFVGLSSGILALWVGGLTFLFPIVIWGLLFLFAYILRPSDEKQKENNNR